MSAEARSEAIEELKIVRARIEDVRIGANRNFDQQLAIHMLQTRERLDAAIRKLGAPAMVKKKKKKIRSQAPTMSGGED